MSDYNIAEAARTLCIMVGVSGDSDDPISSAVLRALQVAQAEAFNDVVSFLEGSGHGDAAKLLLTKVEAMWCRRTESVSPTSAVPPGPARPRPAPPGPGRPATPPG